MKFMKLGSKPDVFQVEGSSVRYVSSELPTDIVINVGDLKFHLHKFPLLSKSIKLQKLISKSSEEKNPCEIELIDFPGGPKTFEICAKFCYGITVTLNPYNVVAVRCASQYLEMSEEIQRGNLTLKIEVFLNSSILRSWKDSIIVLQTSKLLLPLSENLKIIGRCVDAIASKTSVDPSLVTWSYTYNRKLAGDEVNLNHDKTKYPYKTESVPKDWWVEDICELDIDLYKKVMISIKSKGRMNGKIIGEALKTYAMRWLPDSVESLVSEIHSSRNKSLVETIICLLPSDKGVTCSCSFLLKLLKVAILIGADESSRQDLIGSISSKLDEASVSDLLIPSRPPQTTVYDVELVQQLVDQFFVNVKDFKNSDKRCDGDDNFVLGHVSWLKLGKTIDDYLQEIALDQNLSISSFVKLAQSVPVSARPIHDGLYSAINTYLKEHKSLTKTEKKSLCGLMDVKKLTMEASMHAAQNEQLPLRVVVQVLFFEQVRSSSASARSLNRHGNETPRKTAEINKWTKTAPENRKSVRKQVNEMKIEEEENEEQGVVKNGKLIKRGGSKNRGSGAQLLPSRSRRIFDKIWISVGKGFSNGENNNKSSETSGSSETPSSSMIQVETTKKNSSSRNRRHSIS